MFFISRNKKKKFKMADLANDYNSDEYSSQIADGWCLVTDRHKL